MTRPIIFLDFDGVLNHLHSRRREPDGWNKFDPECVERVNEICRQTGAAVVVSSSWRLEKRATLTESERLERLTGILRENGFRGDVVGFTPHFHEMAQSAESLYCRWARGAEIAEWRLDNGHIGPFVILDDDNDMGPLLSYLVQTFDDDGLTDADVERAVAVLSHTDRIGSL